MLETVVQLYHWNTPDTGGGNEEYIKLISKIYMKTYLAEEEFFGRWQLIFLTLAITYKPECVH